MSPVLILARRRSLPLCGSTCPPRGALASPGGRAKPGAIFFFRKAILTIELLDNNAASLSDNRLAPLKRVYFGSNEGRGPVPSVQP